MARAARKISDEARAKRDQMVEAAAAQYGQNVESWYAVYCGVNAEERAAEELRFKGYAVFYPIIEVHHRRKRPSVNAYVEEWIPRPYYPRYLFCGQREGMTRSVMPINETDGVSTVVYFGDRPLSIPAKIIQQIMDKADSDGIVAKMDARNKAARKLFDKGDKVRITDGPFSGLLACILDDDFKGTRVWLEQMGWPLTMDGKSLELA